jgi:hypothetical protein
MTTGLNQQAPSAEARMDISETGAVKEIQMESHQTQMPQSLSDPRQVRFLVLIGGLLVAAIAVFFIVWFAGRDSKGTVALPASGGPTAVSEAQLQKLASTSGHPVYWAGAKTGAYELTSTSDGRVYIRYLPSPSKVGDRAAKYLTVGTYPEKHAFRSIQRAARRPGAVALQIPHGGLLVFNQRSPKSVYFGYPGAKYQVEVYDPSPAQARALVVGGRITPIG